jgi:hypothetical protein
LFCIFRRKGEQQKASQQCGAFSLFISALGFCIFLISFYFWSKSNRLKMNAPFSKYLYIGFLLLGIYQAIFSNDYIQAAASLGIGLAFDPFNPEQKWNDRPTWQKAVMIIHLALVAAMFGFGVGLNDK